MYNYRPENLGLSLYHCFDSIDLTVVVIGSRNVLFSAKPATARASKLMEIAPSMRKKINSMYNKSQVLL